MKTKVIIFSKLGGWYLAKKLNMVTGKTLAGGLPREKLEQAVQDAKKLKN